MLIAIFRTLVISNCPWLFAVLKKETQLTHSTPQLPSPLSRFEPSACADAVACRLTVTAFPNSAVQKNVIFQEISTKYFQFSFSKCWCFHHQFLNCHTRSYRYCSEAIPIQDIGPISAKNSDWKWRYIMGTVLTYRFISTKYEQYGLIISTLLLVHLLEQLCSLS